MIKKTIKFIPYFLITLISLFLLKDLFKVGFPFTHDGHNHLARLANLWITLKSGQFPPRFAPNLDYNFGYPVFNFNYYFSYFFALIFRTLKFSFEVSLKANLIIFYTLGGLGIFAWIKKYTSQTIAFLTSVLYLTFPYQLLNIFIRGNIGESAALGVLPWVLYFIDRINQKTSTLIITSLAVSFFWLTHNLVTLLGLPFIAVYYIITRSKKIKSGFFILLLSVCLTAFFYFPALLEKKFITLDQLNLNSQYNQHFVYPLQLIKDNWQYGFSVTGHQDTMPLSLGEIHLAIFIVAFLSSFIIRPQKNTRLIIFFIFTTLSSIFLLLPTSLFFYYLFPPLTYLQFPWRWFFLTTISLPVVIGLAFSNFKNSQLNLLIVSGLSLLLIIYVSPWTKITHSIHYSNQDYHNFFFTSSVLQENTGIWFDRTKNLSLPTQYVYESNNNVQPQIITWNAKKHLYIMNYDQPMKIFERTAYFPGWKAFIDDQEVAINYQDQDFPGIISLSIPKGNHQIKTIFTQQTFPRLIGNFLSLFTFLTSIIYLIIGQRKK